CSLAAHRPQRAVYLRAGRARREARARGRSVESHLRGRAVMRKCGFTMVEILVALAILAIALTAGMRALAQATDTASALKARTLALWVAQNRLAAAQIATPWPALGTYDGDATQAGARFVWKAVVATTPNPAFRRIEIMVAEPQAPDYELEAVARP